VEGEYGCFASRTVLQSTAAAQTFDVTLHRVIPGRASVGLTVAPCEKSSFLFPTRREELPSRPWEDNSMEVTQCHMSVPSEKHFASLRRVEGSPLIWKQWCLELG